jgi:hypothetical protein
MESIRVGFFRNWGEDTLLIDVDAEGMRDFKAWLRVVMSLDEKVLLGDG